MAEFDIDYDLFIWRYLPVRWRKATHWAWLRALIAPVKWLYAQFTANRNANVYWLGITPQVCYIEKALNDAFDTVSRRIYISDGPYTDPTFIYLHAEEKPVFIDLASEVGMSVIAAPDPVPLYTDAEVGARVTNFIVNVPTAVTVTTGYDVARLSAIVNTNKLLAKSWSINVF